MVPDSILIPRIEAQIIRKEAAANQALEDLATFVKRSERELNELRPKIESKEDEIKALLARGLNEAASELVAEFNALEHEGNSKQLEYESGKADFETSYEEAQSSIQKMQKTLAAIKSESARARAQEQLNGLRKSVSGTRFEAGGLEDDLRLIDERNKGRLDRAAGTKMMLDKATGSTAAQIAARKEIDSAKNAALLERFASKRNLAKVQLIDNHRLPSSQTTNEG